MKSKDKHALIERELERLLGKAEDKLLTIEISKEVLDIVMRESLGGENPTRILSEIRTIYYRMYG